MAEKTRQQILKTESIPAGGFFRQARKMPLSRSKSVTSNGSLHSMTEKTRHQEINKPTNLPRDFFARQGRCREVVARALRRTAADTAWRKKTRHHMLRRVSTRPSIVYSSATAAGLIPSDSQVFAVMGPIATTFVLLRRLASPMSLTRFLTVEELVKVT